MFTFNTQLSQVISGVFCKTLQITYQVIHAKFRRNTIREYFMSPVGNISAPFVAPLLCLISESSVNAATNEFAIAHCRLISTASHKSGIDTTYVQVRIANFVHLCFITIESNSFI